VIPFPAPVSGRSPHFGTIAIAGIFFAVATHIDIREDAPEEGRTMASAGPPNANVAVDAAAPAFRALFLASFASTK
jgi:hypothetical protein